MIVPHTCSTVGCTILFQLTKSYQKAYFNMQQNTEENSRKKNPLDVIVLDIFFLTMVARKKQSKIQNTAFLLVNIQILIYF